MPRPSTLARELSPTAGAELQRLGADIGAAIKVRENYQDFADRIGVSRATVRKIVNGDPGVSLGTFVGALDALGLLDHLRGVAAPERDSLGQSLRLQPKRTDVGFSMDRDF
ncbi:helix-turn-helix domain-containing protein [Marinimicrobium sp. ABcell2]|uniref:helix-turn-helix domain-containing protein n=1 Tax=Marinimicrobium sp. ABcell2 TaxID=3069751 RepID=UPI0027B4D237|nr:helix-turn-helix domain-containing protein [Marinimicrobium sp. ABcell2]MDQ2077560.1 helix-turn-helix domain-containing protein [Marinimicrobium sp. ABcell2]